MEDHFAGQQGIGRGSIVPMSTADGAADVVLLPLLLGGRCPGVRHPLTAVGEHTQEILGGIVTRGDAPA